MPSPDPLRIHCKVDPVIIVGMHRSGTTMVAELLDELGLFVGHRVQGDHEAIYFLEVNEELFKQVHAYWDNPQPVVDFLKEADAVAMSARCVREDLLSRHGGKDFMGWKRQLKYKSIDNYDAAWGWKDPRTVFTLPLWLQLFPKAKIINIVRNGVDVASSLRVRERKMLADRMKSFESRIARRAKRSKLQTAGYKGSARCLSLDGGFALWAEYVARAEENLAGLPNSIVTVRYEDFLKSPRENLKKLAGFSGLVDVNDSAVDAAAAKVIESRANAFLSDPEVRAFYDRVRTDPLMRKHAYDQV